jgi:hypothetical protein
VRSLLSMVLYPKREHFASLTLVAKYWGRRWLAPLTKGIIITQKVLH